MCLIWRVREWGQSTGLDLKETKTICVLWCWCVSCNYQSVFLSYKVQNKGSETGLPLVKLPRKWTSSCTFIEVSSHVTKYLNRKIHVWERNNRLNKCQFGGRVSWLSGQFPVSSTELGMSQFREVPRGRVVSKRHGGRALRSTLPRGTPHSYPLMSPKLTPWVPDEKCHPPPYWFKK